MLSSLILCNKWAGAAQVARKAIENPEETANVFDFILALVLYAFIAAILGGIAAGIAKFVLNKDKNDVEDIFYFSGGVILVLLVISYFVF